MARKDRMSGNEAVSFAIRQINPDVMPAFPITPSTEIPQMVSHILQMEKWTQNLSLWKVNILQ